MDNKIEYSHLHHLIDRISHGWIHYFWEYRWLQKRINFIEEVKTNYLADILSYLDETLELTLSYSGKEQQAGLHLLSTTGYLQLIYVQQDLLDELLYIFKLPASSRSDKEHNRQIRNELVGHPVRRNRHGHLLSSVFLKVKPDVGSLDYVLYETANQFRGKLIIQSIADINHRHLFFLEKYLGQVWKQMTMHLVSHQSELKKLHSNMQAGVAFHKILRFCRDCFNAIFGHYRIFKEDFIEQCYAKRNEHARYAYVVSFFLSTLNTHLEEVINDVSGLADDTIPRPPGKTTPVVNVTFTDNKDETVMRRDNGLHYELSKLAEKHPVFGLDYFLRKYVGQPNILEELQNMHYHFTNDMEYYASYHYLEKLLGKAGDKK